MAGSTAEGPALLRAGYRQVLRVHREKLPPPMRALGNAYAGQEFRAWGAAPNLPPSQWAEFQAQWRNYTNRLLGVADTVDAATGDLPEDVLHRMSPDQQAQLQRLRESLTK